MTKVNKTFLNKNTFKKKKNSINTCRLSEPLNKGDGTAIPYSKKHRIREARTLSFHKLRSSDIIIL